MIPIAVRNVIIGEGTPKICVPIVEHTRESIIHEAKKIAKSPADLVEWRVDWFEDVLDTEKVKEVLRSLRTVLGELPLLFTFRTKKEGGEKEICFEAYQKLLNQVGSSGLVDLIDVEIFVAKEDQVTSLIHELQTYDVRIVGSNHDFEKTPDKEEIIRRLCYMQSVGADVSKIAVMPQNRKDVRILLEATKEMKEQYAKGPIITMSMSDLGRISRVEGEKYGSSVTFGVIGKVSAPGQIDAKELKKQLENIHGEIG